MNKVPAAGTVLSGQTPTVLFPDGLVGYLWVLKEPEEDCVHVFLYIEDFSDSSIFVGLHVSVAV